MDKKFYDTQQRSAAMWRFFLGGLLILSIGSNLVQAIKQTTPMTILIPSRVSGEYQITRQHFDERWLADAATDVAYLWFNVSPAVTNFRGEALLRWVHPKSQQAITEQISAESAAIRKNKMSMALIIHAVRVTAMDETSATLEIDARLTRWIVGREIDRDKITISLTWERDARGAPQITTLNWQEIEE